MDMLIGQNTAQNPASASGDPILDGSTATFVADVIEASMKVPVIVDFWATWCGPCKSLGPFLERAVREAKGKVRLVKIDIDKNQELAAQLRIQSVPTVYAFKDGRPVDGFTGAVPESTLREFIARLTGGEDPMAGVDSALAEAQTFLEEGDTETALAIYHEIAATDPGNGAAQAGILRCLIQTGQIAAAKALLAELPPELANHPDIAAQRSAIALREEAKRLDPLDELTRRVENDPADPQSRFDLAVACFAAGEREQAIDHLLDLFRRDRAWNDGAARKQLVKLFDAMGPADPLTVSARRRLSSLMFS